MDKKDYRIVFELDKNSRISIKELAKKTHVSRDIVAYRMKQLEKEGIIKKYIAVIDFSKLGYQLVRLYLKLQNTDSPIEAEIIDFFVKQKTTLTVYKNNGHYQIAVGFLVKSLYEFQNVYTAFAEKYKKYVAEKNISFFLDYIHYNHNYLVEKKFHDYHALSTGSFVRFVYDKKDIAILQCIKENARISLLDLAKHVHMTAAGVKYKLKNLEKNKVIVGYKLLLDPSKLGYTYYKLDIDLDDNAFLSKLNQYLSQHQNIIYRDLTIGGSDYECDCEFQSQTEFFDFIQNLQNLFPIRKYWYYTAVHIYKYVYFPEDTFL